METVSLEKKRDVLGFLIALILVIMAVILTVFLMGDKKKRSVVR